MRNKASEDDEDLLFEVMSVELEFQVAVTKAAEGGGKFNFWVLEGGGKASLERASTQKVRLVLEPKVRGDHPSGPSGRVNIGRG